MCGCMRVRARRLLEDPCAALSHPEVVDVTHPITQYSILRVEHAHVAHHVGDRHINADVGHPVHPPGRVQIHVRSQAGLRSDHVRESAPDTAARAQDLAALANVLEEPEVIARHGELVAFGPDALYILPAVA